MNLLAVRSSLPVLCVQNICVKYIFQNSGFCFECDDLFNQWCHVVLIISNFVRQCSVIEFKRNCFPVLIPIVGLPQLPVYTTGGEGSGCGHGGEEDKH